MAQWYICALANTDATLEPELGVWGAAEDSAHRENVHVNVINTEYVIHE